MVHSPTNPASDLLIDAPQDHLLLPLPELLAVVRAISAWTDEHATRLDYIYGQRVARTLAGRCSVEDLSGLLDHLRRAIGLLRRAAGLDASWLARWEGMASAIDARIDQLTSQDVEAVLERAHVKPLLKLVAEQQRADPQGVPQALLLEKLGLKKANLTRILNLLEANELIERRGAGRENRVVLGRNVPEDFQRLAAPDAARAGPRAGSSQIAERGISYLSCKAAAT